MGYEWGGACTRMEWEIQGLYKIVGNLKGEDDLGELGIDGY
jgi:hypothetical protein